MPCTKRLLGFFVTIICFCFLANAHDFKITISSPGNGDVFEIGTEHTIKWTDDNHHGADSSWVICFLSVSAGSDSVAVDTFPLPNYKPGKGGTIKWKASGKESVECRIWLRHLTTDSEVKGKGGMNKGTFFRLKAPTAVTFFKQTTPNNTVFGQPTNLLNMQMYDLSGRLIGETNNAFQVMQLKKDLIAGSYVIRYNYSKKSVSKKYTIFQ